MKTKNKMPDFLGIGAARAGTTWLCQNLSNHPDVWIPRIKELHYFTRSSRYLGPTQLEEPNVIKRLAGKSTGSRKYRHMVFKSIVSNLAKPSLSKLKWDCNYLYRRPNDRWYASLFNQGKGKVTGEITPRYSALDEPDIRSLKSLMPSVKLIFVMRDPVERAWSLLRYHEQRNRNQLSQLSESEVRKLAAHPAIATQSDYEAILKRWRAVFPDEQLLLLYYDEITHSPNHLLERICTFLSLDPSRFPQDLSAQKSRINASKDKEMPAALRSELVEQFSPMVSRLAKEYGGYFNDWLKSYERIPALA